MIIEKGKTYTTKHGRTIEIVYRLHNPNLFPFVGYEPTTDQKWFYNEDGVVSTDSPQDAEWDLVAEHVPVSNLPDLKTRVNTLLNTPREYGLSRPMETFVIEAKRILDDHTPDKLLTSEELQVRDALFIHGMSGPRYGLNHAVGNLFLEMYEALGGDKLHEIRKELKLGPPSSQ